MNKNKSKMHWQVIILITTLLWTSNATAALIAAKSCSQIDVQDAINAAIDEDIVSIPPGTGNWSTAVSWADKNIRVIGAGEGKTIINVGSLGFSIIADNKAAFRISAMTINQAINGIAVQIINRKHTPTGGSYSKGWRLDHLTLTANGLTDVRSIFVFGLTYGVIDHVSWSSDYSIAQFMTHYAYTNDNSEADGQPFNQGTISWGLTYSLGDANAIYVEDSTLNASSTGGWAADVWYGGSVVFRYNTINRCQISTHSARSTARGGKRIEVYNNKFVAVGMSDTRVVWWRSGTGVVFNNTIDSTGQLQVDNQRTCSAFDTRCSGTQPYDGNISDTGWPCLDQPGRGYGAPQNQPSMPIYAWNNGPQDDCRTTQATCANSTNISVNSNFDQCLTSPPPVLTDHLKTGAGHANGQVDYVNNGSTAMPGYKPYTYPHPLTLQLQPPHNLRFQ
ncbi:MAG TPA: hypothetical protein VEM40_13950 [Nitrospirota bacterium]|nr:hypothetical protein [Nitrospirota bacterium]